MIQQTEPLHFEEVKEHILDWVLNKVSVANPQYNNFPPCPFAKRSIMQKKLDIHVVEGPEYLSKLNRVPHTWDDKFDMVMLVCHKDAVPFERLVEANQNFNEAYKPMDLMTIFDYPGCEDPKFMTYTANGKYIVTVCQRRERFLEGYNQIYRAGYVKPNHKASTTLDVIFENKQASKRIGEHAI